MATVPIQVEQITEGQTEIKSVTVNRLVDAVSSAALFGIRSLTGRSLVLYGGTMILAGVPTTIPNQTLTLADNATNYVYSTAAGVFVTTTTAPAGWPGPLAAGAIALYQLVTASGFATTDWHVYVPSLALPGLQGPIGPVGPPGENVPNNRLHWLAFNQNGGGGTQLVGFGSPTFAGMTPVSRTMVASSLLRQSMAYVAYELGAAAGTAAQWETVAFAWRGNAAPRGGFVAQMRFCFESDKSPSNYGCFFGLWEGAVIIGNVEPDTIVNCVGVGSKRGDANLSAMYNDGAGTCTMDALGASFPARNTDNVYELTLTAAPFASSITYKLLCCDTGVVATGVLTTNIPSNSVFLKFLGWQTNGSSAANGAFGIAQVVGTPPW